VTVSAERLLTGASIGTAAPKGGVLGLLPALERDALGLLTRCMRDYGDLVHIRCCSRPATKTVTA
jgi:hypothetical protein